MADEKTFAEGLIVKERAFSWGTITALSFKAEEFKKFLDDHTNDAGWVNVDIKKSRDGSKLYGELNTYVAEQSAASAPAQTETPSQPSGEEDDLPF